MLVLGLLGGCLINTELYEQRAKELTDHDGDTFAQQDDCDDDDARVFPGAEETCDGRDEDCDDEVDEGAVDAALWYGDTDGDGYGDRSDAGVLGCAAPRESVANALDCDDGAAGVYPGAAETAYNAVDEDCDGTDLTDVDGDGYDAEVVGGGDCDDGDRGVNPGGEEVPYDGVDQDCQAGDADDLDGDGAVAEEVGGSDCDDANPDVRPLAEETWGNGLTDNDCDGEIEAVRLDYGAEAWIGASAGGQVGRRLGPLGDVTGDGLADYLVGAVYEASVYPYGGAVYLVEGGREGGDLAAANVLLPGGENWFLPQVSEGGPDVSGDGVPDFVATATGYEGSRGAAFLVDGAEFGASSTLSLPEAALGVIVGDNPGEYGGTGAAFLGDVMGDGAEYLAVTSLFAAGGEYPNAGVLAVFDVGRVGSLRVSDGDVLTAGPYEDAAMGNLVVPAGDVDGDGVDDYMVSVSYGDLAYVLPGGVAAPTLPEDAIFRLTGTGAGEVSPVEMLGDVDGDGARDLACIYYDEEVRVFTTLAAQRVVTVAEPTASIALGEGSLAFDVLDLGDLDADGRAETFVPLQWYPALATSFAAIIFGEELGFRATAQLSDASLGAASLRPNGRYGYRVARSADVDGDGSEDILIGGHTDSEGGTDAGAVLTIPVPR